jgi:hypothetical protein
MIYLEDEPKAAYKRRASASRYLVERFLQEYKVHDAFVHDLLGRPDYWSSVTHRIKEGYSQDEDYGPYM